MNDIAAHDNRFPASFYVVATVVLVYVALCTGQRDNVWEADAWEYHRVVLALTEQLWNPGNPTYDTLEPSARYSPYAVTWAVFSRVTGTDPYRSLSIAAVVNTALLIFGAAALLRTYGDGQSATAGVIVMFSLFGGAPGFTCSYALSDQPWIGMNPSAFSLGVTVWIWVLFRTAFASRYAYVALPIMTIMAAVVLLDHAIVGGLAQIGLWLFALTAEPNNRLQQVKRVAIVGIGALGLSLLWPWFSFSRLILSPMPAGMLSGGILKMTLFRWCLPAVACSLLALLCRDRKIVRVFLLGGTICYLAGLLVWLVPEWVPLKAAVARLPLPGLLFFHLAIGVFAHRYGIFNLRTWPDRFRRLLGDSRTAAPQATLEILFGIVTAYCLIPQLYSVLEKPHLARAFVAPMLDKEDKQLNLKHRFDVLLAPIGRHDVVLSDITTSWPIPSSRGRIVYAVHPEWFSSDELERKAQVERFFDLDTSTKQRIKIMASRNVKWIMLNRQMMSSRVYDQLYCEPAVVSRDGDLILMEAGKWIVENS